MVSHLVSCTCPLQCMVCMVSGVLFQGWDNGTLGNTISGCVTQNPRVGASEDSAIHPTHTYVCVLSVDTRCVYTNLSSPRSTQLFFTTLDTAVLSSVHSYGAQMWTKLKIDVERRSMFIRKTRFLSSNSTNNARTPLYYGHTSVSANTRTLPYPRY